MWMSRDWGCDASTPARGAIGDCAPAHASGDQDHLAGHQPRAPHRKSRYQARTCAAAPILLLGTLLLQRQLIQRNGSVGGGCRYILFAG